MSIDFTWTVDSVDTTLNTIVVKYEKVGGDAPWYLNIPAPQAGITLDDHVLFYAPISVWNQQEYAKTVVYQTIEVDTTGSSTYSPPVVNEGIQPFGIESQSKIEIKALIQEVLAEMSSKTV
jgi:hypothetical protein